MLNHRGVQARLADLGQYLSDLEPMRSLSNDLATLRVAHTAMATEFEVVLYGPDLQHLRAVAQEAFDEIDRLEEQLSAYRPTSDVCWINRTAFHRPVRVEPGLFDLLQTARRIWQETDGAFDITVGPLVRCWGFFRRGGASPLSFRRGGAGGGVRPSPEDLAAARARVGMQYVELDPAERTVRFLREGVELNLGGIAKGYAVQWVADRIRRYNVASALVHSGQSSIAAWGTPPPLPPLRGGGRGGAPFVVPPGTLWVGGPFGWRVGLGHPRRTDARLGVVRLRDEALSTSGDYELFFEVEGRTYSHLLDPRTGEPASGLWSTWVVASDAAVTDALSTAFFVLGVEGARDYCEQHDGVAAFLCPARGDLESEGEPELLHLGRAVIGEEEGDAQ